MRQQQLESKLELHTALHEKLALTLSKVSYKEDILVFAIHSKREGGNFLEYTYEAWSENLGEIYVQVTSHSQEGEIYATVEQCVRHDGASGIWHEIVI